jgi:Flp pilus assembly pilin Flp
MTRPDLRRFPRDEDGAATVDWVVLTASLLTLGLVILSVVRDAAVSTSEGVGSSLDEAQVPDIELDGP